jgi:flagellar L-ring protein precursor FlgH
MRVGHFKILFAGWLAALPLVLAQTLPAQLLHKLKLQSQPREDALNAYLDRARGWSDPFKSSPGSLWNPDGRMSDLATDAKARYRGDVVQIQLAENTSSALQGTVQTQRTYTASSGIAAFFGLPAATSPVGNMFSPSSSQVLNGKGQTALSTTLTTTLAANVVEVLPNGQLVIEATRDVEVTDQRQTMVLHGIVHRQDISPANVVSSTAISHLEVNLTGKGVITEGTHPPNGIVRILLRVVGF